MRKHPVIFGMFILLALGISFYFFFYKVGLHSGKNRGFSLNNKIGVVSVEGIIADSQVITEQLDEFGKDDSIVAIVLRVDSPGGGVAASQEIYDAVIELKKKKKVVDFADGRVFSGRRAKELGLVDYLGDMSSAAKLASKLAGKDGKYDLVYPSKKRTSVFDYLLESTASQISNSLKEKMQSFNGLSYLYYPVR